MSRNNRRNKSAVTKQDDSDDDWMPTDEHGNPIPLADVDWSDSKEVVETHRQHRTQRQARGRKANKTTATASTQKRSTSADRQGGAHTAGQSRRVIPILTSFEAPSAAGNKTIRTVFAAETEDDLAKMREQTHLPLQSYETGEFHAIYGSNPDDNMPYSPDFQKQQLGIPQRPPWDRSFSRQQINHTEQQYFTNYLTKLYDTYGTDRLNHFEHNLDVWRHLWRVCERSDILLLLVDIRNPLLHFNWGLYDYVTKALRKPMVIVLNKIDTVPYSQAMAWKTYFQTTFPNLHVVVFSSYPTPLHQFLLENDVSRVNSNANADGDADSNESTITEDMLRQMDLSSHAIAEHQRSLRRAKRSPTINACGAEQLLEVCQDILENHLLKQKQADIDGVNITFDATRLLSRRDHMRMQQHKEKNKERAEILQQRLKEYMNYVQGQQQSSSPLSEPKLRTSSSYFQDDDGEDYGHEDNDNETNGDDDYDDDGNKTRSDDAVPRFNVDAVLSALKKEDDDNTTRRGKSASQASLEALQRDLEKIQLANEDDNDDDDEDDEDQSGSDDDEDWSLSAQRKNRKKQRGKQYSQRFTKYAEEVGSATTTKTQAKKRRGGGRRESQQHDQKERQTTNTSSGGQPFHLHFTIGTIGHPNAGKSSLINALAGKKVVSVSRQPGKTKIQQTIKLNEYISLCDCPGLIFPVVDLPKPLQVLCGIFPIPQTRSPVSAVMYLAMYLPLPDILGLDYTIIKHFYESTHEQEARKLFEKESRLSKAGNDSGDSSTQPDSTTTAVASSSSPSHHIWTAYQVCEAFAIKRGYMSSRGSPDVNRAAQQILYSVADSTIQFYFWPETQRNPM